MGHALILLESLAAALLLVAFVAACTARWRLGLLRWAVPLLVALVVLIPVGATAYGLWYLAGLGTVPFASVVAVACWGVAFLIGAILLLSAALRPTPDARPWSRRALAVAFVAAAALTAITVANLDVAVRAQLAAVQVEAGARALALVPGRLAGVPNAAPIYRKAFAALPVTDLARFGDQAEAWEKYDRAAFDPADPAQREFLDRQQAGLALLREAAAVPYCSFDRDWSIDTSPLDMRMPELHPLRHGATLLAYDALARATRKDARGAIDNVAAIFAVARHVHYPLLLDVLVASAIERTGANALEDVLALGPIEPADLARLKIGTDDSFRDRLRRTFGMEEAWGLAAFALIATGRGRSSDELRQATMLDDFGEALLASPVYRVFFLEDDLATYRRHMRTMREHAGRAPAAMLDGFAEHDRQLRATRGGGILAGLLIPAAHRVAFAALDADARRALARTAVAASAYRAKHGRPPEKVGDLVPDFLPETPLDPFDGRPLRLRKADDGLVIYSLGRDRADDGGEPWDDANQAGDLTFRLRR